MFSRFTALLPAPTARWEAWRCLSATSCHRVETTDRPSLPAKSPPRVIIALPAQSCRTLALRIPSQDPKMVRQLAFAQLEKRGLAAATPEQTIFACLAIPLEGGGAVLSVDIATPEATAAFASLHPAGFLPSARCYSLPDGPLIITGEHGRLVLWAAHGGTLIHSHIISAAREHPEQFAAEVRLTILALRQQGLLTKITGLEMWGGFTDSETAALSTALDLPVHVKPHPAPDPAKLAGPGSLRLLPAAGRASRRGRQLRSLKGVAAAALAGAGLLWWAGQRRSLVAMETKAGQLEEIIEASSGSNSQEKTRRDQQRAIQERWQGLRMALEPRRYPLIHLDHLTRCLGGAGIALDRFESKGPALAVSGTAQSAREAYAYYRTLTEDAELRIFEWSMVQPVIAANGTATFQVKGKMR